VQGLQTHTPGESLAGRRRDPQRPLSVQRKYRQGKTADSQLRKCDGVSGHITGHLLARKQPQEGSHDRIGSSCLRLSHSVGRDVC
jgi:hypothetical protein